MNISIISLSLKKWSFLALLSLILCLPAYVSAQKTFQGVVTYKLDAPGNGPKSFTYYVKGKKARIEMEMPAQSPMGNAAIIIDGESKAMITLIPQMKMYMQMPMPDADTTDYGDASGQEKPVKVGDSEVILGHNCDHWKMNSEEGGTVDLWNAKGFGNFMMPGSMGGLPGRGKQPEWMKEFMAQGFFPLKVIVKDKNGNNEMTMEATKVDEKTLNPSLFEVPSGFNKMSMPNMGQQN